MNDTLNKLRIGLTTAFSKVQQAENIANKEVERAKAILEKRRREIACKAAEMERQNGARTRSKEGWCDTFLDIFLILFTFFEIFCYKCASLLRLPSALSLFFQPSYCIRYITAVCTPNL